MYLLFHALHLCCPYLFLISPSCGASGRLYLAIVTFPGYLHLYFHSLSLKTDAFILLVVVKEINDMYIPSKHST